MHRFEVIGTEMAAHINDPEQRAWRLICPSRSTRFVVCGTSGSGKTRAIEYANSLLPSDHQIAESREIAREADPVRAKDILEDESLAYEASAHIAFAVYSGQFGKALEREGVKVFWLDDGNTSIR